jgi:hypothetical protein
MNDLDDSIGILVASGGPVRGTWSDEFARTT